MFNLFTKRVNMMEVLNNLLMEQYLLKKKLKEVSDQIKKIQEKDAAQMDLEYHLKSTARKKIA